MALIPCPECSAVVDLGIHPSAGQRITCAACQTRLEVITAEPLELDWAFLAPSNGIEILDKLDCARVEDDAWERC